MRGFVCATSLTLNYELGAPRKLLIANFIVFASENSTELHIEFDVHRVLEQSVGFETGHYFEQIESPS